MSELISINDVFNRMFDERGVRIVLVESKDDVENVPWFCGRDVCEILGYVDYRNALHNHIEDDCKQSLGNILGVVVNGKQKYTHNERQMAYINKRGLETLISKNKTACTKSVVKRLIDEFQLNVKLVHRTKEQEFIGAIISVFGHELFERQYTIGSYRIDLYFPDLKIAVECDELGHRDRDKTKEHARQSYIEKQLNCKFFRFNPDTKDFDIFKTIGALTRLIYCKTNA
jgi:hypothetical protein